MHIFLGLLFVWVVWFIFHSLQAKAEGFKNLQDKYNAKAQRDHPMHDKAQGLDI